ncbi:MAG TPA: hypothetical protein VKV02_15010 [Acidobacteriaceae bacterium]|nr:hypothetical protein [Acidobacteriaceae bacterium]
MGHAEIYVTWVLLVVIALIGASTCWGVWRLLAGLHAFQRQVFGYRENLD